MSALGKLIEKIDELCQKIDSQREEIKLLKDKNQELELSILQKEQEISEMLANQSSGEQKLEALFSRMERALNDNQ
ncbi:hypothetical protein [Helicobacter kayseriensis]|uniref:hypothetical protein n=1 Tax=Helicobacter kayseriensis TaxID=2905877 RepID=UPI001E43EC64|nr:hypothetical protein [Helicobacter kayseriensis]MCE3047687.1 hypothetical protein [Helicobacter kayseriensis]MCE3049075.1 hypothetical protein [Helicobacter kayseriensis]